MERPGTAPGSGCLQGIRAAFCSPHGAQSWFRSTLFASSARRFHQISLLGIGADIGNRNRDSGVALRCLTFKLCPRSGGSWTESNLLPIGTAFTVRRRHQPVLTWHDPCWLRAGESNPAPRLMRPRWSSDHLPAKKVPGFASPERRRSTSVLARSWRKAEVLIPTPLPVPSRFERAPVARPVDLPYLAED